MKKLIAALVLATSFAAFADDAAKTAPPAKSEKKTEKKTESKTTETAKPAPATEKAPEKK
ncbi:MAG TPA: hypothetical protein VFD38_06560 [Myxococcaceae bacterium]|nr:hypothetical protein [Myxococcaceae bacterium]